MSEYRFCPVCGSGLELKQDIDGVGQLTCEACSFVLYRNSKPCSGALVIWDGQVLLVKRALEPHKDQWDIPGGFLEDGEHPENGARRELLEETGLTVRLTGLVGMFIDLYPGPMVTDHTLNIYYTAEIVSGVARPASDAAAMEWFPADKLPEPIGFKHCRDALAAWRASIKA